MRAPIRHAALVLAGSLLAVAATLAPWPDAGSGPGSPGSMSPPDSAEREGRLATPAPEPLCGPPLSARHHRDESSATSAPQAVAVPILAYHYVRGDVDPGDELGARLSVSPPEFAAQMDLLRRSAVRAITLDDLVAALHGDVVLPPRAAVITFDDGYADFARNALPVLQRDHLCATLFAIPGFLGRPGYLTALQLHDVAGAGVRIGAHTMTHLDLSKQPPDVVADEVSRSGDVLRALTGQPVHDFAYPFGAFDATAVAAVQAAGFSDAVALALPGPETYAGRFTLPRREVVGGEPLAVFAADTGVS